MQFASESTPGLVQQFLCGRRGISLARPYIIPWHLYIIFQQRCSKFQVLQLLQKAHMHLVKGFGDKVRVNAHSKASHELRAGADC
jgi:hypothetical protein